MRNCIDCGKRRCVAVIRAQLVCTLCGTIDYGHNDVAPKPNPPMVPVLVAPEVSFVYAPFGWDIDGGA